MDVEYEELLSARGSPGVEGFVALAEIEAMTWKTVDGVTLVARTSTRRLLESKAYSHACAMTSGMGTSFDGLSGETAMIHVSPVEIGRTCQVARNGEPKAYRDPRALFEMAGGSDHPFMAETEGEDS